MLILDRYFHKHNYLVRSTLSVDLYTVAGAPSGKQKVQITLNRWKGTEWYVRR